MARSWKAMTIPFPCSITVSRARAWRWTWPIWTSKPAQPNGHTVVLLHGKNFCSATWEGSIQALSGAGYRVIAPDQIGWCKSTKPAALRVHLRATGGEHP